MFLSSCPIIVISGTSLGLSRKIVTSTGFHQRSTPDASAPVVAINFRKRGGEQKSNWVINADASPCNFATTLRFPCRKRSMFKANSRMRPPPLQGILGVWWCMDFGLPLMVRLPPLAGPLTCWTRIPKPPASYRDPRPRAPKLLLKKSKKSLPWPQLQIIWKKKLELSKITANLSGVIRANRFARFARESQIRVIQANRPDVLWK